MGGTKVGSSGWVGNTSGSLVEWKLGIKARIQGKSKAWARIKSLKANPKAKQNESPKSKVNPELGAWAGIRNPTCKSDGNWGSRAGVGRQSKSLRRVSNTGGNQESKGRIQWQELWVPQVKPHTTTTHHKKTLTKWKKKTLHIFGIGSPTCLQFDSWVKAYYNDPLWSTFGFNIIVHLILRINFGFWAL